MTSIALIFPHTRLAATLAPLTLLFCPALLRPVADGSGCSLPDCPCQAIEPPSLGEHLPRFLSLVADITSRGAAEGMSRLLLEARAPRRFDDDETSRRLAVNIMATYSYSAQASDGATADGAVRSDDLLWDERLLLTLAEFLDDQETGINDQWRQLDDRYCRMLAGLRGDGGSVPPSAVLPPAEVMEVMDDDPSGRSARPPVTRHIAARLKAWSRLYGASDAKAITIWACLEEAADELFEMRAAKNGLGLPLPDGGQAGQSGQAVELGEIALPSRLAGDGGGDGQNRAGLAEMAGRLAELLARDKPNPDDFQVFSKAWRQKLDEYFPKISHGRLRFYDLGNLPAGKVLGAQGELAAAGRILAVWQPGV